MTGYKRCKKCKELISIKFVGDCPNCKHRDDNYSRRFSIDGKKPSLTLDIQEGNSGAWGDRS